MSEIIITNQKEWDELDKNFESLTKNEYAGDTFAKFFKENRG